MAVGGGVLFAILAAAFRVLPGAGEVHERTANPRQM